MHTANFWDLNTTVCGPSVTPKGQKGGPSYIQLYLAKRVVA